MNLKAILKKSKLTYAVAKTLRRLPNPLLRAWMRLCHGVCGVDKNKVYFSSFNGRLYNENPRYVCEALHEICPEAKIVFRLNQDGMAQTNIPDYVKKVPLNPLKSMYHMATAKVIVENNTLLPYMLKFKDQKYLQLWHGDRGLKTLLAMINPDALKRHPDWKLIDLSVSGSDYGTRINMRSGFGYQGEMLQVGYPRNDVLLKNPPQIRRMVYEALKLPENTRFVMYAPTFRNSNTGSAFKASFSGEALVRALEESSGERWMILNRGHILNGAVKSDAGMDVSRYPEVSELLLVCDMLITDYSSIAGDFLLLNRPIILYHPDGESYERNLVFDPAQSPYKVAHNMDELIEIACHFPDGEENCRALAEFYGVTETGRASELTAQRIREYLNEG